MYKKRLNFFHPFTRKFQLSTIVFKNNEEIGEYKKINGSYTVWVMNIGRLEKTYRNAKEAFEAIKTNYKPVSEIMRSN